MEKRITKRIKDKATKSMHTVGTVKDFEEDCILFNGEWIEKLNSIKVRVIFGKNIEKKRLCRHDKNYYHFWKSDIPVINLIVDSKNMIKVLKNTSL